MEFIINMPTTKARIKKETLSNKMLSPGKISNSIERRLSLSQIKTQNTITYTRKSVKKFF